MRNRLPDPAHADHAQNLARDMGAQHLRRCPSAPAARPHQPLPLARAAAGAQDQGHRDIRRRIGDSARRIAHRDPSSLGRRHVDMVVPNPEIGEEPGPDPPRPGLVKSPCGKGIAQCRQDRVIGAERLGGLGLGHARIHLSQGHVKPGSGQSQIGVRQLPRNQ